MFAALVVPWFVDWNNFRSSFEAEAERILGHPVRVNGTSDVNILPSPSLSFTNVEVGDVGDIPMAQVDQFDVTIELMPLLQGEIRVVSMKLLRPVVNVRVDQIGRMDWLERGSDSQVLDVDKVILESVEIEDGVLSYDDFRTGISQTLRGIRATVSARGLSGPWKVDDASYDAGGRRVPFSLATGRMLDDGTMRVTADIQPPQWPVDLSTDGKIGRDPVGGLYYDGTFDVRQIGTSSARPGPAAYPWRSEGAFVLNGDALVIDRAVLSSGSPDRPSSLAGSLTINFGENPSFTGSAEANQIDLDRTLGLGPSEPLEVAAAAGQMVDWLQALPAPTFPGHVNFNVPVVVVGGSIIQDFALAASYENDGWKISDLGVRLPGQARLRVTNGVLRAGDQIGFEGDAELIVLQPATFAGWWRGQTEAEERTGRLLSAFDLSGHAVVRTGRISIDELRARVGAAEITGQIQWGEAASGHRSLGTDLKADRIDFAQLKALAELLAGRNFDDTAILADDYKIRVAAAEFATEDFVARDVFVDAAYTGDVLTVIQLSIGDLGGASYRVTSGQIKDVTTANPSGVLAGKFTAQSLEGLTRLATRMAPDSGFARWLEMSSPVLVPAVIDMKITAPPEPGGSGMRIALEGVAGATTVNMQVDATIDPQTWRDHDVRLDIDLYSPDSSALLRQLGVRSGSLSNDPGGGLILQGRGVPAAGIETTIIGDIAGLISNGSTTITFPPDGPATLTGAIDLTSDNIEPAIALAGLSIPGAAVGTPISVEGVNVSAGSDHLSASWRNAALADRTVSGEVAWRRDPDLGWRLGGELAVDEMDLSWLTSLGLGFAPLPTGAPEAPWSGTLFSSPTFGSVVGQISVETDRFYISDDINVANTHLDLMLQPQRLTINATNGEIAGGQASANLAIHNVGGNASLTGGFDLKGAALDSFIWQRDGRAIATGTLDISANFESTGRSPAGLVSSLTGGGAMGISAGVARYVNPGAARLVIRESDVGQEFTEESLRRLLAAMLDADSLEFGTADAAFAIAAGAVRMNNIGLKSDSMEASGNAVLDLNTMTIDSDWTLSFDPGDAKVIGTIPKAGLVFRGPLAAPERFVDVLQFDSYLNMRLEVRMLEIIELEEAARLEATRLRRLIRTQKEDAVRREIARTEAAAAEARRVKMAGAALVALTAMHVRRDELAALKRVEDVENAAERAREASLAAQDRAQNLARAATAAGEEAAIAAAEFDDAVEAQGSTMAARSAARETNAQVLANVERSELDQSGALAAYQNAEAAFRGAEAEQARADADAASADGRAAGVGLEADVAHTLAEAAREAVVLAREAAQQARAQQKISATELDDLGSALAAADLVRGDADGELEAAVAVRTQALAADQSAGAAAEAADLALTKADSAVQSAEAQAGVDRTAQADATSAEETAKLTLSEAGDRARAAVGAIDVARILSQGLVETSTEEDRQIATAMELVARNQADQAVREADQAELKLVAARSRLGAAQAAVELSSERAAALGATLSEAREAAAVARRAADLAARHHQDAAADHAVREAVLAQADEARASAAARAEEARLTNQAARQLADETSAQLEERVAAARLAEGDEQVMAAAADLSDKAAAAARAVAERMALARADAEAIYGSASERLEAADAVSAELARQLAASRASDNAAAQRLDAAIAARVDAQAVSQRRDRDVIATENGASQAAAQSEGLILAAKRATEFAQRVSAGLSTFDEPATLDPSPVEVEGSGDEAPQAEETEFEIPTPRLRPALPLNIVPQASP